jgi:predicted kinase
LSLHRSTVYILVGVQGSGKTTWARAHADRLRAIIVASDDVRNELEAQGMDATDKGDLVFRIVEARLRQYLAERRNVIVDATHARVRWREKEIAIARAAPAKVMAVWFDIPLEVCLARNAQKPGSKLWGERVVPSQVLRRVALDFQKPTTAEFDEVWRITIDSPMN